MHSIYLRCTKYLSQHKRDVLICCWLFVVRCSLLLLFMLQLFFFSSSSQLFVFTQNATWFSASTPIELYWRQFGTDCANLLYCTTIGTCMVISNFCLHRQYINSSTYSKFYRTIYSSCSVNEIHRISFNYCWKSERAWNKHIHTHTNTYDAIEIQLRWLFSIRTNLKKKNSFL